MNRHRLAACAHLAACASLALALGCQPASKPPAPAGSATQPASAAAPASEPGPADGLLTGLRGVAARCKAAGTPASDFQRCTDWRRHAGRLRRDLGSFDPQIEATVAPFTARIEAALGLLGAEDPWERAAARGAVEVALNIAQYRPSEALKGWVGKLATRLIGSADQDERVDVLRILGNHGGQAEQAPLVRLAIEGDTPVVQAAAWAALARCVPRGCRPSDEVIVQAWQGSAQHPQVKGALAALAGRLGMAEVLSWCAELLDDPLAGPGCRSALKHRADGPARALLLARARRLVSTPPAPDADAAVALAVADLLPVADLAAEALAAGDRPDAVYVVLGELLGQPRSGLAVAQIASQLLVLKDRVRAADLAVAAYQRIKAAPEGADQALAESRLRQVVSRLGAGPRIGLKEGDGHGHAGHGHGHEGHGHEGHGHEGHGH